MEGDSPTVARRRVRLALREAREAAGLTQLEVAEQMEWSLSKVIRIESGDVSISPHDLRPMLTLLRITDRAAVTDLLTAARIARTRQRRLWHQQPEYREHLPYGMQLLIEYESDASRARYYSALFLPDVLQTRGYAASLSEAGGPAFYPQWRRTLPHTLERRREALLSRPELDVRVLLDESVLRRTVGGAGTMVEQLRRVRDWAADGQFHIRLNPFAVDAMIIDRPAFDLISLGEHDRLHVLYQESSSGGEITEDRQATAHYRGRFDRMWAAAVTELGTLDFIQNRIEYLEAVSGYRRKADEAHHLDQPGHPPVAAPPSPPETKEPTGPTRPGEG